jgi:hypothetical protein
MDMKSAASMRMGPLPQRRSESVPCQGTLRHVIDLHAQAHVFFFHPYPQFHTLYSIPVKRGPTALLNHTISHRPARTIQRKGRQMCINRAAYGLGGLLVWVLVQSRRDMCGEEWRRRLLSLLFVLVRRLHLATD